MLQFDRQCSDKVMAFRELMVKTDKSPVGKKVLGDAADADADLWWWEHQFLPTLVEAFSCGFGPADLSFLPEFLPPDIRTVFHSSPNHLVPKVWRLTKGFLTSAQLQRADVPGRQQVFEPSHFIPFMDSYVAPGHEWTRRGEMGVAIPVYQGPNVWFAWHVMAQRFADIMDACKEHVSCKAHSIHSADFSTFFPAAGNHQVCVHASILRFGRSSVPTVQRALYFPGLAQ